LEVHEKIQTETFPRAYWFYMIAAAFFAAGFADFALIAYHFQKSAVISPDIVPIYYAVAMAMGAIGGLVLGKLFDRLGMSMLLIGFFLSALAPPLLFLGNSLLALAGMVLWGIGMGTQGSLLNAIVSELVPANKRSTAFGFFDAAFGVAWFIGSWVMGILYDKSIGAVVILSVLLQLVSLPIFFFVNQARAIRNDRY
jgi:predicted MFS family arabinose efflux permease